MGTVGTTRYASQKINQAAAHRGPYSMKTLGLPVVHGVITAAQAGPQAGPQAVQAPVQQVEPPPPALPQPVPVTFVAAAAPHQAASPPVGPPIDQAAPPPVGPPIGSTGVTAAVAVEPAAAQGTPAAATVPVAVAVAGPVAVPPWQTGPHDVDAGDVVRCAICRRRVQADGWRRHLRSSGHVRRRQRLGTVPVQQGVTGPAATADTDDPLQRHLRLPQPPFSAVPFAQWNFDAQTAMRVVLRQCQSSAAAMDEVPDQYVTERE